MAGNGKGGKEGGNAKKKALARVADDTGSEGKPKPGTIQTAP